jgi:transcriptional regulator with XRE-family HTH domain
MRLRQTVQLINLLAKKRAASGLSIGEVARRAGVDIGTVSRIESGRIANPKPETLQAIGEVLGIPASDLFATAGWVPSRELPSIRPYLRTKYRQLPPEAMEEIEAHFEAVAREHGVSFDPNNGPLNGEDE